MKKLVLSLVTLGLLCSGSYLFAQVQVKLMAKPAPLVRQGDIWIAPADESVSYYSYTANGNDYVCTVTEPTELVGTAYSTVSVRRGTGMMDVRCYSSSLFVGP